MLMPGDSPSCLALFAASFIFMACCRRRTELDFPTNCLWPCLSSSTRRSRCIEFSASSSSSLVNGSASNSKTNWRASTSSASSSLTGSSASSAYSRYSNASVRSLSTVATSVSSASSGSNSSNWRRDSTVSRDSVASSVNAPPPNVKSTKPVLFSGRPFN